MHRNAPLVIVFLIVLTSLCSTITYVRNAVWHDRISLLEDIIRQSPLKARAYYNLGNAYGKLKQTERAIELYSNAIALDPRHAGSLINRGNLFDEKGEYGKAILDYNAAISINPEDDYAYYNRGVAYNKIGRKDAARDDYRRSCQLGNSASCEALQATEAPYRKAGKGADLAVKPFPHE